MQRGGGDDAIDFELVERASQPRQRKVPSFRVDNDLGKQGVIVRRHDVAWIEHGVDAHPGPGRECDRGNAARRWSEIPIRILGIDPHFDRSTAHCHVGLRESERTALRDENHLAHEIDSRDELRDRMLDLDARVHLDKEELAGVVIIEIFERSRAAIPGSFGQADGRGAQRLPRGHVDRRRGRLLPDLLAAALQRALALETVHDAMAITQNLHLEMARVVEKALEIEPALAEGGRCFGLRRMKVMRERRLICGDANKRVGGLGGISRTVAAMPGVYVGISRLPAEAGLWLRVLAIDGAALRAAMECAWRQCHESMLG